MAATAEADKEKLAIELKNKGNEFYKVNKFRDAAQFYMQAIAAHPTPAIYCNLSIAHIKNEAFGSAILEADKALKLDVRFVKAYYRKGTAYIGLGQYKKAKKQFETSLKLKKSAAARKKFAYCKKMVQREKFQRAIKVEQGEPLSKTMNVDDIAVDSSYDGPRLVDGKITLSFVKAAMERFKSQKLIHRKFALQILLQTVQYLKRRPTLIDITLPCDEGISPKFTVCGDTHGQYYDLCNIFELNGLPSPTNPYLFNGDYVDRGSFAVENVLTLFMWQLLYPKAVYLTRGNHETKNMNKIYGFEGEVVHKYDQKVMDLFTEVFNWLPLCAVIQKKVFCVHGGIFSKDGVTLDDIRKIKRNCEPPDTGLFCDMLWSDPSLFKGRHPSKRGVSSLDFGEDITKAFLKLNGLDLLVRSHEVQEEGYKVIHDGKCVTIFSAPNYCDQMGNKGAMIVFDQNMMPTFKQFVHVPHPPIKPMAYAPNMSMFGF